MSAIRIETITKLKQEAQHGGILLRRSAGRKARKQLIKAEAQLTKAREKVMHHEYATAYRLWILGGSQYDQTSLESQFTEQLSQELGRTLGIDINQGAGPGIMHAAALGLAQAKNQAQREGKEISARNNAIGLQVGWEEKRQFNLFDYYRNHPELLTRVQELLDLSHGAYVGPGAIGTNLELWAIIQLKQMGHLEPSFALVVHPSWKKSIEDFRRQWYEERIENNEKPLMRKDNLDIIFSDNIPEIVSTIRESYQQWYTAIGQHTKRGHFWNRKKY